YAVLLALYRSQTEWEQANAKTSELNGSGFASPDAPLLTLLAETVLRGGTLSAADEETLIRRLPKYWSQFVESRLLERDELDGAVAHDHSYITPQAPRPEVRL